MSNKSVVLEKHRRDHRRRSGNRLRDHPGVIDAAARVVIGDLDLDAANAAVEKLADTLLAEAVDGFGSLDMVVNNASITDDATIVTEEDLDLVISVHLKGAWYGTRESSANMREAKRGAIVNISSLSDSIGLTKAAAKDMAHHRVRINAIQPT